MASIWDNLFGSISTFGVRDELKPYYEQVKAANPNEGPSKLMELAEQEYNLGLEKLELDRERVSFPGSTNVVGGMSPVELQGGPDYASLTGQVGPMSLADENFEVSSGFDFGFSDSFGDDFTNSFVSNFKPKKGETKTVVLRPTPVRIDSGAARQSFFSLLPGSRTGGRGF